jgi:REP element-mobilizing transposase RayT
MTNLEYKQFSERHRPHIQPPGAIFFVTYRLAGSVPQAIVREYKAKRLWLKNQILQVEKTVGPNSDPKLDEWLKRMETFYREWFVRFEDILHKALTGPMWMKDERVAAAVCESLHKRDGEDYRLDAFTVMSNHVHTVLQPFLSESNLREERTSSGPTRFTSDHPGLSRIMHRVKGSSSRECNLVLNRSGQFWEHESFDHYIRAGQFFKTIRYVLNNPVKAGLIKDWREWRWSYCRAELIEKLGR